MGTYLNPDNQAFLSQVNDIYIDKSMLIEKTNERLDKSSRKFICVSRPRRFGKTIASNMLAAYYSKGADSKQLFSNLKISFADSFSLYLNKFNVLKIDLNAIFSEWRTKEKRPANLIFYLNKVLLGEFRTEFSGLHFEDDASVSQCIKQVYNETKEKFIVIIDEYDVLVREQCSQEDFDLYLAFLNSLFKNSELASAISLAYITGILPVMRDKIQSKLNVFDEITMTDASDFGEFTGFTTDEVKTVCEKFNLSFEECKSWYDGYKIGSMEIYNPRAVVQAALKSKFKSYWSETSTYKVVADKIEMNFSGTKEAVVSMLSGEKVKVNVEKYDNSLTGIKSRDDVLTFLIHLGYLAYDEDSKSCYIPNREVHNEWVNAIEDNDNYAETNSIIQKSKLLLEKTLAGDEDAVASALDTAHNHVSSNLSYNNEYALQSAIYLSYIYALNNYTVVKEMPAGNGVADITYIPFDKSQPAFIVELKHNKSAQLALTQIKTKKYFECLSAFSGDLLLVGINYDEKTKKHECKIEKFFKD